MRSDQREQKRMRLHMGATNPFHVYLDWHVHTDATGNSLKGFAASAHEADGPGGLDSPWHT